MAGRMTIAHAESLGLIERQRTTFGRKSFVKDTKRAPARMPKQLIQESPMEDGSILYTTHAGAWMKVSDVGIVLRLPYPITANQIWRNHDNNTLLSESAKKFRRHVHSLYAPLLAAICWRPYTGLIGARIIIQPPSREKNFSVMTHPRYDVDNYSKPLLDALKSNKELVMVFRDDRLVLEEDVRFAHPVEAGCAWMGFRVLDDADTNWLERKPDLNWLAGK